MLILDLTQEYNVPSILTPIQITATANLLQNQGFTANTLLTAVGRFTSTSLISPLVSTVAASANVLPASTIAQLVSIAANSCPAISDSMPAASASSFPASLMTTILTTTANTYLGNGDVSKFAQALAITTGYVGITNQFINSTVNGNTYLGNTFTNYNNMMSGSITAVNICTQQWSQDLQKLGGLINLANLSDLGSPVALIQQLASFDGIIPEISLTFTQYGVSTDTVVNLTNKNLTASDADQKAMYTAMTHITGAPLAQILQILGVTTPGINTMADLLNPVKIFPTSFQTLTVTDVNKVSQNIYLNSAGTINATLKNTLPSVALYSTV